MDRRTDIRNVELTVVCINILSLRMDQSTVLLVVTVAKCLTPQDVESEALSTLIVNKLRGGIKVCAVKAPGEDLFTLLINRMTRLAERGEAHQFITSTTSLTITASFLYSD